MKHLTTLALFLHSSFFILHSASAAVPLKWTVETSRAKPETLEAYQGETLDFEAALQSYGKPLEAPSHYAFYWQTNGMGSAYWEKEVVVDSRSGRNEDDNSSLQLQLQTTTNVLFATWSPEMDVGAKAYNCFIGLTGSIYHAAFQLRLRPSPGAVPNELPLPQKVIDFAQVTVLNPPWSGGGGSGGVDTNAVIDIANATIATNATITTLTSDVSTLTSSVSTLTSSVSSLESTKLDKTSEGGSIEWNRRIGTPSIPVLLVNSHLNIETGKRLFLEDADAGLVNTYGEPILENYAKKTELDALFSLTSSVSRLESTKADEFTAWVFSGGASGMDGLTVDYDYQWELYKDGRNVAESVGAATDAVEVVFSSYDPSLFSSAPVATRERVLYTGDAATPQELTNAISTNNPAFVSAVQSISPPSLPSLRLYDAGRGCYWIGRMVNGVISWEVEE